MIDFDKMFGPETLDRHEKWGAIWQDIGFDHVRGDGDFARFIQDNDLGISYVFSHEPSLIPGPDDDGPTEFALLITSAFEAAFGLGWTQFLGEDNAEQIGARVMQAALCAPVPTDTNPEMVLRAIKFGYECGSDVRPALVGGKLTRTGNYWDLVWEYLRDEKQLF